MDKHVLELWTKLDLITPMAVRAVATLRVADLIAAGHDQLPDLATKAGVDAGALGRLLRYLIARDIFSEPSPGRFALNDLAEVLLDDHATATRGWLDLDGFGGRMDLAFFDLLDVVKTGRPEVTGHEANLSDAESESYDSVMEAQSRGQAPGIAAAYDWRRFARVVDVGGGTGTLLAELLRANPELRGTLLDLPKAAAKAPAAFEEAGVSDRAEAVGGDLFEVMPEGGDAYVLKFVLHFLEDDEVVRALTRCRQAGAPAGRVVVIERSVAPGDDQRDFTSMDMRMLILGHGRERTLDEYGALAAQAGLSVGSVTTTADGLHLIELR